MGRGGLGALLGVGPIVPLRVSGGGTPCLIQHASGLGSRDIGHASPPTSWAEYSKRGPPCAT